MKNKLTDISAILKRRIVDNGNKAEVIANISNTPEQAANQSIPENNTVISIHEDGHVLEVDEIGNMSDEIANAEGKYNGGVNEPSYQ